MNKIRQKYEPLTLEDVLNVADNYSNRTEFSRGSGGAYNKARQEGYLDIACAHMPRKQYPITITLERVRAAAEKCTTRSEFYRNSKAEYAKAVRKGWLDKVCRHMPENVGHRWNKKALKIEAARYQHRVDFMKQSQSAYKRAFAEGCLDDICKHMTTKDRRGAFTLKEVAREARKYKHRSDFSTKSVGAYRAAHRNGWLEVVCAHMTPKPRGTNKQKIAGQEAR
jgi:hypothetical protein